MQNVDLVIKNCKLVIPKLGVIAAGVAVNAGKIVAIASDPNLPKATKEIDAEGNYVFPGVIDTHTHYGVPSALKKEFGHWADSWKYETRASAIGGVTTAINLTRGSYTNSAFEDTTITDASSFMEIFDRVKDVAEENSLIDFRIAIGIMTMQQVDEMTHYVKKFGVSDFKLYRYNQPQAGLTGRPDPGRLFTAFEKVADLGHPAIVHLHCENFDLCNTLQERMQRSGRTDYESWYDSTPPITESESTASAIMLAEAAKTRLLVIHISCIGAVDALVRGKQTNPELYGETCPQYLVFTKDMTEEVYPGYPRNLLGKNRPPWRAAEDVERLWEAIAKGEMDVIGSDHVPSYDHLADKGPPKPDIWSFLPGFASSPFCLPVLLSEGINKRGLPFERVAEVTSYNAAKIMGLYPQKGTIAVGSDADFTVVDMNKKVIVKPEMLKSLEDWTVWDGIEFKGWPVMTILRGNIIVENGEIVGKPGTGRYLPSTLRE